MTLFQCQPNTPLQTTEDTQHPNATSTTNRKKDSSMEKRRGNSAFDCNTPIEQKGQNVVRPPPISTLRESRTT